MNLIRTSVAFALTVILVGGCSNSNSPSPTSPGSATTTSVQVTSAFVGLIPSAQASGGSGLQMDEQNQSFDILNESFFSEEVSAGATSSWEGRSASAAATSSGECNTSWEAPGVLSSLDVDFVGGGEASTAGPETVTTNVVAGISGTVGFEFVVPTGGMNLEVELSDRITARVLADDISAFNESFPEDDKSTLFLPAGSYTFSAESGGGVSFTDSPHSESDALDASLTLRFLAPTP